MQKRYSKSNFKTSKLKSPQAPQAKTINRSWGLAARFKQCHIKRIRSK